MVELELTTPAVKLPDVHEDVGVGVGVEVEPPEVGVGVGVALEPPEVYTRT